MEYRNFELRIQPLHANRYSAVVTDSPHGKCQEIITLPMGLCDYRIQTPEGGGRHSRELASESTLSKVRLGSPRLEPEEVGRMLFDAVFTGKIGDVFRMGNEPGAGLRLKLVFQDGLEREATAQLHQLPWELLFFEQHLAVSPQYSIVRQLDGETPTEQSLTPVDYPFKPRVLVVGSNPNDANPLDLARERVSKVGAPGRKMPRYVRGQSTR